MTERVEHITLNGEPYSIGSGCSVSELIETFAGSTRGSAVVVDDEIIPRSRWDTHRIEPGQRVELVTAVPGG